MQTEIKAQESQQQVQPTQQINPSQTLQENLNANAMIEQENKQSTIVNGLSPQQKILLQNFNKKPFLFVPPPIYTDITTTQYRDNMQQVILPYTNHYQMFNVPYDIRTGKQYNFSQSQSKAKQQIKQQNKSTASLKVKVHNLKFLMYTMYTQMGQILKVFGKQDVNGQKAKSACLVIKHKVQDFYKESNQIKQDYRRIQVIHMLQKQIQYLNKQTKAINSKVAAMEKYVDDSLADKSVENAVNYNE